MFCFKKKWHSRHLNDYQKNMLIISHQSLSAFQHSRDVSWPGLLVNSHDLSWHEFKEMHVKIIINVNIYIRSWDIERCVCREKKSHVLTPLWSFTMFVLDLSHSQGIIQITWTSEGNNKDVYTQGKVSSCSFRFIQAATFKTQTLRETNWGVRQTSRLFQAQARSLSPPHCRSYPVCLRCG